MKKTLTKKEQKNKDLGSIRDDVVEEVKKIKKSTKKIKLDKVVVSFHSHKDYYWKGFMVGLLTILVSFTITVFIISQTQTPDEIYSTIQSFVDGYPYQPGGAVEVK
jgi:hypothetical protein